MHIFKYDVFKTMLRTFLLPRHAFTPSKVDVLRWVSVQTDQTKQDHYSTLGVSRDASTKQLRDAFLMKSKELHPDSAPQNVNTEAEFIAVREAYSILSKPRLKRLYDAGLPVSSSVFDKSKHEGGIGNMRAGDHVHNPMRSNDYKNPYAQYDEARKVADRWTDYHNPYGTSRAKRRMRENINSSFWSEYWSHSREHGGGGPQLPTHKQKPKRYWKVELVALACLAIMVAGAVITFTFLYGTDPNHPVAMLYLMSKDYIRLKMSDNSDRGN